jgi:hypothetical protein
MATEFYRRSSAFIGGWHRCAVHAKARKKLSKPPMNADF